MIRKRVCMIHVGGTIGMAPTEQGFGTRRGHLGEALGRLEVLQRSELPLVDLVEYEELLDSADMMPGDWQRIAEDVMARASDYDGFVILHGTDTMAYTASALSFMLENLDRPVVLTGSQIPLCEVRSDAASNLVDAVTVAGMAEIPEVMIQFGGKLFRGNRTVKVSADGFQAFDSPNFPPLGRTGVRIRLNRRRARPAPSGPLRLCPMGSAPVAALRLFPGIDVRVLRPFLESPLEGLVLEAYGVGNGPSRNRDIIKAIADATAAGLVVVVVSQCLEANVHLREYTTGAALAEAGCVGGRDLTAEAAMTKLLHLFGRNLPVDEVRRLITVDLRGELTA